MRDVDHFDRCARRRRLAPATRLRRGPSAAASRRARLDDRHRRAFGAPTARSRGNGRRVVAPATDADHYALRRAVGTGARHRVWARPPCRRARRARHSGARHRRHARRPARPRPRSRSPRARAFGVRSRPRRRPLGNRAAARRQPRHRRAIPPRLLRRVAGAPPRRTAESSSNWRRPTHVRPNAACGSKSTPAPGPGSTGRASPPTTSMQLADRRAARRRRSSGARAAGGSRASSAPSDDGAMIAVGERIRFESTIRSERVAAILGIALGVTFTICFATGLYSHSSKTNRRGSPLPRDRPASTGSPRACTWRPASRRSRCSSPSSGSSSRSCSPGRRSPASRTHSNASRSYPSSAAGSSMLFTGLANINLWYPWAFNFPHRALLGRLDHHRRARRAHRRQVGHAPAARSRRRRPRGRADRSTARRRWIGAGSSRRSSASSGLLTLFTVGQTFRPLRRLALLAPRRPDVGPRASRSTAPRPPPASSRPPATRLPARRGGTCPASAQLVSRRPPRAAAASTRRCRSRVSRAGVRRRRWTGVPVRDLLRMAGADDEAQVTVHSLQQRRPYKSSELDIDPSPRRRHAARARGQRREPRTSTTASRCASSGPTVPASSRPNGSPDWSCDEDSLHARRGRRSRRRLRGHRVRRRRTPHAPSARQSADRRDLGGRRRPVARLRDRPARVHHRRRDRALGPPCLAVAVAWRLHRNHDRSRSFIPGSPRVRTSTAPGNPTVLPLDYPTALLTVLGVIWALAITWGVASFVSLRRRAPTGR